jgi:hypothetical protein
MEKSHLRAAGYVRVSGKGQVENQSLDTQRRLYSPRSNSSGPKDVPNWAMSKARHKAGLGTGYLP